MLAVAPPIPVANWVMMLFIRVGLALPRTSIPVPAEAPTNVLFKIRPKGTGRWGCSEVSPWKRIPEEPAMMLFWMTTPGTRRSLLICGKLMVEPGWGTLPPAWVLPGWTLIPC